MRFFAIEDCVIAEDAIEIMLPPKDGEVFIRFKSGQGRMFSEPEIDKLKQLLTLHTV
jgi:hypothetical protein